MAGSQGFIGLVARVKGQDATRRMNTAAADNNRAVVQGGVGEEDVADKTG